METARTLATVLDKLLGAIEKADLEEKLDTLSRQLQEALKR